MLEMHRTLWPSKTAPAVNTRHLRQRPERMTARDEILAAIPAVARSDGTFTVEAIVRELRPRGSRSADSTIHTQVTSRMCANPPGNHAVTDNDLARVETGVHRRL
jgi:hypothetical protein